MASLVVACASLTMVAATATGQRTQGGTLQGTWEMQITLTDCAGHVIRSFPSLIEFVAGGTVVESNAGTPQALKTPGEGVWRHTTDNNYAFRFKFFTFNSQNVFTGWTIIAGEWYGATEPALSEAETIRSVAPRPPLEFNSREQGHWFADDMPIRQSPPFRIRE